MLIIALRADAASDSYPNNTMATYKSGSSRRGLLAFGCGFLTFYMSQTTLLFDRLIVLLAHIGLYITKPLILFSRTMVIRAWRFNIILLGAALLSALAGCKSPQREAKKQVSTLRVHLETSLAATNRTEVVSVFREQPMRFQIEKIPILNEGDIVSASIIDVIGGFALQIKFDQRGSWLLEQATGQNPSKHLLIFSQFSEAPEYHLNSGRWLAAPRIEHRIAEGTLSFTPDATREEAEAIVKGLSNVAKKVQGKASDL